LDRIAVRSADSRQGVCTHVNLGALTVWFTGAQDEKTSGMEKDSTACKSGRARLRVRPRSIIDRLPGFAGGVVFALARIWR